MIKRIAIRKIISSIPQFRFCNRFYPTKEKQVKYQEELPDNFDQQGRLKPSNDSHFIRDWDDKFDIQYVRNHTRILSHLAEARFSYSFNDLGYFIRHLTSLNKPRAIQANPNFSKLITHVKKCLKENDHELYPYIGSYAFCFRQLGVKDEELWKLMEQKILKDQWYTNFRESVFAVEAFTNRATRDLYKRIERIIRLTIWEVDPKHYQRISVALAEANQFDPETFNKLEEHILKNLSLNYHTSQMVDILLAFAKGKQGSARFYESMQYVIFKGHMFNKNMFLQSQVEIQYDGQVVSKLMEIYNMVQNKYVNFELHPDFKNYIFKMITNKKTVYHLESATRTLKMLREFRYDEEDVDIIHQLVFSKVLNIDGYMSIQDIMEFYEWGGLIPEDILKKIEQYLIVNKSEFLDNDLSEIYNFLNDRPYLLCDKSNFQKEMQLEAQERLNNETNEMDKLLQLFKKQLPNNSLSDIELIKRYQKQS